jgi:hypothetical protein
MVYTAAAQQYILACNLEVGQIHVTLLIWQAPLSMHLRQGHAALPARQCATAVVTGQATSAAGSKHAPSKEALGNIPFKTYILTAMKHVNQCACCEEIGEVLQQLFQLLAYLAHGLQRPLTAAEQCITMANTAFVCSLS